MEKIKATVGKTSRYLKRNGLKKTFFAVTERLHSAHFEEIEGFKPLTMEEYKAYKALSYRINPLISIVVPCFETDSVFFKELLESVANQTYENWELVLGDASATRSLEQLVSEFIAEFVPAFWEDLGNEEALEKVRENLRRRMKYHYLDGNLGISENTNKTLEFATGDYIGLLDHDDILTYNALSEIVNGIEDFSPILLYSDEDKTDKESKTFYEPHLKRKFNLDLILSNNYICHFTVIRADVIKELGFRKEFDGAQDYDLFLRCIARYNKKNEIVHIPKILYHWRCHEASTASNTDSKTYAYESGKKAVAHFCEQMGWDVAVTHTSHLGFYRVNYMEGILKARKEVGAVGGPIFSSGKISGGAMKPDGTLYYGGLNKHYSGYMHRASMMQDVYALDLRNMEIRPELVEILNKYKEIYPNDMKTCSIAFCKEIREKGYLVVYDPERRVK